MNDLQSKLVTLHVDPPVIEYQRAWIALLTEPNREEKAFQWLTRIAWKSPTVPYWPHKIVQMKIPNSTRGQKARARSMFTGMLFASIASGHLQDYDPFAEFAATPGIRDYIRTGQGYPAFIPDWEMAIVSEVEQQQNNPEQPAEKQTFKLNDKVKIKADLMEKLPAGTISRVNGDGSFDVEIPGLFGMVATMRGLLANQVEAV